MTRRNDARVRQPSGAVPERLVTKVVRAAVQLGLDQVPANQVLGRQTAWLVAEAMTALSQHRWQLTLMMTLTAAVGQPMA